MVDLMENKTFLDNAQFGKNNWWRYLLTCLSTWVGSLLLLIILLIPVFIIFFPVKRGMDAQAIINNLNPLYLLVFIGLYYILSFFIFYLCTVLIHHKKFIQLINITSKVNWKRLLKGAGLWLVIMGLALLVGVALNPAAYKLSFSPAFFTLLIISLIIYPVQASFEEVFFRGYLLQGVGLLTRRPVIPLLITSALFAVMHFWNGSNFSSGMGMVISMFIFGLTLGIITLGEKGLETAMGVHIANNLFLTIIFSSTGVLSNIPSLITSQSSVVGVPFFILPPILLIAVFWRKMDKLQSVFKKQDEKSDIEIKSSDIHCNNCGTDNPESAEYCMECGARLYKKYQLQ